MTVPKLPQQELPLGREALMLSTGNPSINSFESTNGSISSPETENHSQFTNVTLHNEVESQSARNCTTEKTEISPLNKKWFFVDLLSRKVEFKINKPLIPLKLALFLWFGAGAVVAPFLQVYFKQLGLAIKELTIIYIVIPPVQFFGTALSGIIADKIGRTKPVLIANLIFAIIMLNSILLIPNVNQECRNNMVHVECNGQQTVATGISICHTPNISFAVQTCSIQCNEFSMQNSSDFLCQNFNGSICETNQSLDFKNFTFSLDTMVSNATLADSACSYDVSISTPVNSTYSWCTSSLVHNCNLSCTLNPRLMRASNLGCNMEDDNKTKVFIICLVFLILFTTFLSNTYRIMDVTTMSMVKRYNSDFGRERFWSILSVLVFSSLSGLLVQHFSPAGGPKNYAVAFYCFDILTVLMMIVIWKLDVQINPPGKNMWKKSIGLLKNPDVIAFMLVLVVVGTTWGYIRIFSTWYLDQLKAPSILLGLIPSVGSLIALPFLLTSKWWVKKIGTTNFFVLALVGYSILCIGYSFLIDPWWSLAFEVTNIFGYFLFWVAVVCYSHDLAPEGLTATVIASAGGIHFGIGKGSGSLIGGLIMSKFGGRTAYQVMAGICASSALFYSLYLYLRRTYLKYNVNNWSTTEEEIKQRVQIHRTSVYY